MKPRRYLLLTLIWLPDMAGLNLPGLNLADLNLAIAKENTNLSRDAVAQDTNGNLSNEGRFTGRLESFDLKAEERGIAWEDWHKRVSHILTKRLTKHASTMARGFVVARVTITCDKKIQAVVLNSSGSPRIVSGFLKATDSLNGSEELLFPQKSQRDRITFNYSFKRSLFTLPKHEWIRDDVELIDENK